MELRLYQIDAFATELFAVILQPYVRWKNGSLTGRFRQSPKKTIWRRLLSSFLRTASFTFAGLRPRLEV